MPGRHQIVLAIAATVFSKAMPTKLLASSKVLTIAGSHARALGPHAVGSDIHRTAESAPRPVPHRAGPARDQHGWNPDPDGNAEDAAPVGACAPTSLAVRPAINPLLFFSRSSRRRPVGAGGCQPWQGGDKVRQYHRTAGR
jgi:hypothetical protein